MLLALPDVELWIAGRLFVPFVSVHARPTHSFYLFCLFQFDVRLANQVKSNTFRYISLFGDVIDAMNIAPTVEVSIRLFVFLGCLCSSSLPRT